MFKIQPVIMCGGSGTRVWPESRESLPKQFISLVGDRSTFQSIVAILKDPEIFLTPLVITNKEYRFRVAEQLEEIEAKATIVLEPMARDSGAAVAVAAALAARVDPQAIVAVLAADHVFENAPLFVELCREAGVAAASGSIVTFGVMPDHPATGYGYIHAGALVDAVGKVRKVERFVEKPDEANARKFVAEGYLWNSGNFVFRADVMLSELEKYEPEIMRAAQAAIERAHTDLGFLLLDADSFALAPKKSIDYAVMERTGKAAVIAADIGWSDVGSWAAVWELSDRDASGNSVRGAGVVMDARNVHIRAGEQLTAVLGVDDIIVVTTQDAVLVTHRSRAGEVKQLVERLKSEGRREASEHKRGYRPWGYYQSIDQGGRYQVKRIVVKPGGRLSLQKHFHRAEHWIVVRGTAEVTLNEAMHTVHENESIYLPIGCVHRVANPGKIDLELIEVQVGSYLGEDDIVRIEDVYNRT